MGGVLSWCVWAFVFTRSLAGLVAESMTDVLRRVAYYFFAFAWVLPDGVVGRG